MQITKLGVKRLYPEHKVSSIEVVFHFLAAYSINLEKEVAKILEDKKVVNVTIERSMDDFSKLWNSKKVHFALTSVV